MRQYLDLVEKVLREGKEKHNRTGIDTISITGGLIEYDWGKEWRFPILTSKKMAYKSMMTELEFFIKGKTNKKWLKDRNCHIWDEWCSPKKVPYGTDEVTKEKMKNENDLGPIYGYQWRNFDGSEERRDGADQLANIVTEIKTNPESRRMVCSAWNPNQIKDMALPPCHVLWQVLINTEEKTLDLVWFQRSCDLMLGVPFNLSSYATLQYLLCLESGKYSPGKLVGMLSDLHIYKNHLEGAKEQLKRKTHELPKIRTENFKSIFNWEAKDTSLIDYVSEDKIKFEVAV